MLEKGTVAPAFEVDDQNGNRVTLEDLPGKWVVLWWFPKADTSG